MQTIQWQNLGVSELATNECEKIIGGEIPSILKGITWATVITTVAENWGDIKQGFLDGWNSFDAK